MSDRLGLGALSAALGDGYGYEHDTVVGVIIVTYPDGYKLGVSDLLTLDEALEILNDRKDERD